MNAKIMTGAEKITMNTADTGLMDEAHTASEEDAP